LLVFKRSTKVSEKSDIDKILGNFLLLRNL